MSPSKQAFIVHQVMSQIAGRVPTICPNRSRTLFDPLNHPCRLPAGSQRAAQESRIQQRLPIPTELGWGNDFGQSAVTLEVFLLSLKPPHINKGCLFLK